MGGARRRKLAIEFLIEIMRKTGAGQVTFE
jgi:hypothetical protein